MGKYLPTGTDSQAGIQKKSRKKSKHTQLSSEEATLNNVPSTTKTKPPGTTLPTEGGNPEDDDNEMTPETSEQRKARKKALKASRNPRSLECIPTSPAESAKKGKKRKREAEDVDDNEEAGSTSLQAGTVEGPPKKKHKNRTGFADPREDANLNSQSRKALEYAFTQMNRPSKWKFNKARQNWLIRNIWAPEALPEVYFPLAVKYLAAMQGGSREKLTQTCQSYINGKENAEKKEEEKTINPLTATVAPRSILKPTPGPLIDPSLSSKAIGTVNTDTTAPIPSSISAVTLADVRCTRARVLLDILSQSTDA